jgi:hypothetical protein
VRYLIIGQGTFAKWAKDFRHPFPKGPGGFPVTHFPAQCIGKANSVVRTQLLSIDFPVGTRPEQGGHPRLGGLKKDASMLQNGTPLAALCATGHLATADGKFPSRNRGETRRLGCVGPSARRSKFNRHAKAAQASRQPLADPPVAFLNCRTQ